MTGNNEGQGHMTLLLHNTNMNQSRFQIKLQVPNESYKKE